MFDFIKIIDVYTLRDSNAQGYIRICKIGKALSTIIPCIIGVITPFLFDTIGLIAAMIIFSIVLMIGANCSHFLNYYNPPVIEAEIDTNNSDYNKKFFKHHFNLLEKR